MKLEDVVVDQLEVINQLDPQVASTLDVIFNIDKPIDLDVDSKAVRGELSRNFFVYFNKHVVRAFNDAFFAFLFADTVDKAKFV